MRSLLIGKSILMIWKNKWWESTKQLPLLGLLPIVFFVILIGCNLYIYSMLKDVLLIDQGSLPRTEIIIYLERFIYTSLGLIIIALFILWQLIVRIRISNALLESLPVRKYEWKLGQMVPVVLLLFFIFIGFLLPYIFFFLRGLLELNYFHLMLGTLFYALLAVCAACVGIIWQQMLHLLSTIMTKGNRSNVHRLYHGVLLVVNILLIIIVFQFSWANLDFLSHLTSPITLYLNSIMFIEENLFYTLGYFFGLILYSAVAIMLLFILFRIEGEWQPDENNRFIPLEKLSFLKQSWVNIFILELKRVARDSEHIFYIVISIFCFGLLGYGIHLFIDDQLDSIVLLFELSIFFGIPEVLAIFAILSRGRDDGKEAIYFILPIKVGSYIFGKLTVYITIFPIISLVIFTFLLWLTSGTLVSILDISHYLYYNIIIFGCAFLLGVIIPCNPKQFISVIINMLIGVSIVSWTLIS